VSAEVGVLVGIVIAAVAVFFVTRPFRERVPESGGDETQLANLLAQREAAYQVLRDLDGDFQTGKLAEDDYRPLRVQALAGAAEIVAQLDALEKGVLPPAAGASPRIEAAPPRRRRITAFERVRRKPEAWSDQDRFCPKCGSEHEPDDEFCRKCGVALTGSEPVR
jgi:hypothetical protein